MFNNLKKVTSAAVAGAVVLGSLALYPTGNKGTVRADAIKFDSASAINYATILGGAVDYGIVADTIYQNSHTETTFATNHFWHNVSNIDADYIDSPALFLIGEDLNTTDPNNNYNILFGYTRASAIFLEAPDAVFGPSVYGVMGEPEGKVHYKDYNPEVPAEKNLHNGNIWFTRDYTDKDFIQTVNENANSNVNRLINRVCSPNAEEDVEIGWSHFLQTRANSPEYKLDNKYITVNSDNVLINITDPKFDGKVVYVDITEPMLNVLREKASQFRVKKNPSSVVVFNLDDDVYKGEDTIQLRKPYFEIVGVGNFDGGHTDWNGGVTQEDREYAASLQTNVNEKVIWNIMESAPVTLQCFAGAVLAPNSKTVSLKDGNSCGWIVTAKTFDMREEFHFLYNSSSRDTYGQMHFAFNKAFTEKYAPHGEIIQDTSKDVPADTFKFTFKEYDSLISAGAEKDVETVGGFMKEESALTNGTVTFDSLSFYCDSAHSTNRYYIPKPSGDTHNFKEFYFRVTEDPASTDRRYLNSDGYIDIILRVEVDKSGNFTYFVKYKSVTGDDIVFRDYDADYIKMSGVQFDLGVFYNKVKPITVNISKRDINKADGDEVPGAKLKVALKRPNPEIDLSKVTLICDDTDVTDTANLTKDFIEFESGEKPTSIEGLKPGDYTLTETLEPAGFKPQTTVIEFTVSEDGNVTITNSDINPNFANEVGFVEDDANDGPDTVVILDEMYQTNVTISKRDAGGQEIAGATLTLTSNDTAVDLSALGVTAKQGTET
ncbi:MAG: prealbumin-like fold domain-containing protein, partial [Butyrivibrio hungatei]|nr:prealbumin-like fold domain-containing protein [Butyrivibrio hungatei]